MSDEGQNPPLALVVKRFKHAAIALHYGYEDEDEAMQLVGIDAIHRAVAGFDAFGPNARLALGCLLDHSDHVVRAVAARHLLELSPERAVAVLDDIQKNGAILARSVASSALRDHERRERKDDSESRLKREGRNFSGEKPNPAIQFTIYAIEQTRDSGPFDTRNLPA